MGKKTIETRADGTIIVTDENGNVSVIAQGGPNAVDMLPNLLGIQKQMMQNITQFGKENESQAKTFQDQHELSLRMEAFKIATKHCNDPLGINWIEAHELTKKIVNYIKTGKYE